MASLLRSGVGTTRLRLCLPTARAFSASTLRGRPFFPDEPVGPTVVTPVPGPKNKAAAADLQQVFDIRSLNMFTDYTKSIGN